MADRRRYGEWQGRSEDQGRGRGRSSRDEDRGGTGRGDLDRFGRDMATERTGRGMGGHVGERDADRYGRGGGDDRDMDRDLGGRGDYGGTGRYGRGHEYGGDEDRGRFDQDSREEYHRGGLMRGTPGVRRAGGPGQEYGEGFWSELTHERTRGDFDRYGARGDAQRTQHYDTDRWDRGQYALGASVSREDYDRYGWGQGWSQDQGDDRGFGTRGFGAPDYEPPRVQSSYLEQRPRTGYFTTPTRDMDREAGHGAGRGGMQGGYGSSERSPELPRRGRGPRNYQRSDDRIREDLCERLMQAWMDADDVDVRVDKGEVTLSGTVKSRDEKRAIEDLAEDVLGVKEVHNEIRVAREQPGQERRDVNQGSRQDDRTLHS
ncbi:MAG TPA: BON domain-containing protein [Archangium sp.]|uniref:BON domain-containing protein n=1 Tax=Archangium sp. TaxID=1872627 RepID=UPI002ED814D3